MTKICIIGDRGHLHYVFLGLPALPGVEIAAISNEGRELCVASGLEF